jgi:uncharacterized membrane-anchored protein
MHTSLDHDNNVHQRQSRAPRAHGHPAWMRVVGALAAFCLAGLAQAAAPAEMTPEQRQQEMRSLPWVEGPNKVGVGTRAEVKIEPGQHYLDDKNSGKFLSLTGNLPSPGESILLGEGWWAAFNFAEVGYVKDNEKLDPDALLKELKGIDGPANEERKRRGMPTLHTVGWVVPPHYDPQTKHLEFGLRMRSDGSNEPFVNYTVRMLGRTGYENVILVSSQENLTQNVKALKTTLQGFDFKSGEKYAEFKPGDRVAEFGLGALIVGGGTALLAKTGWWKGILAALAAGWKLVAIAVAGLGAGIVNLFKRKKSH